MSEEAYLGDVPVVLTASRLAQPVSEAPAAVTVIDQEMIRQSGAWDLAEIFRLVPGMYVAYHASRNYTTETAVSYHGLADAYAHRMQVLVDGRSVYTPTFGGVLWSDIPLALDDIERIEIIRGPNSASYGANSFLGIINIITRHSSEQRGKFLSLTTGRSRDEVMARYGGRSGDLTYRLTAGYRNDQGLDRDIISPVNPSFPTNKYDDKRIKLLTFRGDYRLSATDELEFQLGYNGGDRQEGEDNSDFYPRFKRVDNHFELVRWRRHLGVGDELSIQFYHSYESSYDILFPTDPAYQSLRINADAIAQRYDLEAQHIFSPREDMRLVWGGSVRLDRTYFPLYFNTLQPIPFHLSRLFGNLEWRARPDLVFNLGAMVENNSFTGTDITPRAAANWHLLAGHTLRASYSKATRTPTLYEQKGDNRFKVPGGDIIMRYAVENLKPERIASAEIGYLGKFPGLDVDFRLFRDELSDLITSYKFNPCGLPGIVPAGVLCVGTNSRSGHNAGNATVKGFETQIQWRLSEHTRLNYGLAHLRISSNRADDQPYDNSAPTNSQSLLLTHSFGGNWSGSLTGYQVGEMTALEDGRFVNSYRRWDGRLARRFRSNGGSGEIALVVQNLADERHEEYRWDNQVMGRSAWLNMKLEF